MNFAAVSKKQPTPKISVVINRRSKIAAEHSRRDWIKRTAKATNFWKALAIFRKLQDDIFSRLETQLNQKGCSNVNFPLYILQDSLGLDKLN